jgi:hypothetical protein
VHLLDLTVKVEPPHQGVKSNKRDLMTGVANNTHEASWAFTRGQGRKPDGLIRHASVVDMNPLPADGQDGVHAPQDAVKVDVGDGGDQGPAVDHQTSQSAEHKSLRSWNVCKRVS